MVKKARHLEGGKGKGKRRKGPVKGSKDVGLSERSKPKFKRNPHKAKARHTKEKVVAKERSGKGTSELEEAEAVKVGSKRRGHTARQEGAKGLKVSQKRVKREPLTRKERRNLKKQKRKNYDIISRTLQLWEKLRRHDLKEAERAELLEQMLSIITGHIHEFALKHDTARIIQCCLKYGTPQQHTTIFNELKDHIVELSKSKYAKFTVKAMMRLCTPEQRHQLISALYGSVHRLARHREAAEVVETAYNDYANASERAALVQEFYGRKFALFKSREGEEKSLEEILEGGAQERGSVLCHMKEALMKLLDKSVVKHSIVHRALLDFLTHCDETSSAELIDTMKDVVVEILHTRDGSRVALQCLWHGTVKNRKVIVKSFKPYVKKICMEENGHVVVMGVFDTVDDTVLVRKAILSEMVSGLAELCDHQYGRRVLLYLLSPRNRLHFSSQFLESVLQPGDGNQYT
jgi:pumilio family protein 6